jgi:hypothetical protein
MIKGMGNSFGISRIHQDKGDFQMRMHEGKNHQADGNKLKETIFLGHIGILHTVTDARVL